jgi:hypothetical protein
MRSSTSFHCSRASNRQTPLSPCNSHPAIGNQDQDISASCSTVLLLNFGKQGLTSSELMTEMHIESEINLCHNRLLCCRCSTVVIYGKVYDSTVFQQALRIAPCNILLQSICPVPCRTLHSVYEAFNPPCGLTGMICSSSLCLSRILLNFIASPDMVMGFQYIAYPT